MTGSSGFIGTNLVTKCIEQQIAVRGVDRTVPRNPAHREVWKQIDFRDKNAFAGEVADFQPDIVFHLGARTDLRGETLDAYSANTIGVRSVISACNIVDSVRRVVFASSRLVCKIGYIPRSPEDYCPTTLYGMSKAAGETLVRGTSHRHEWVIVRPTSIWGPWFSVPYRNFFDAVERGRYAHIRGRDVKKSFGYVGNTVYQLLGLAQTDSADLHGQTLYLADYSPVSVRHMAELIRTYSGARAVPTIPLSVLRIAAGLGDILQRFGWSEPPLTSFRLNNLMTEMVYDTKLLQNLVGPLPYSLDRGVYETVAWLNSHSG